MAQEDEANRTRDIREERHRARMAREEEANRRREEMNQFFELNRRRPEEDEEPDQNQDIQSTGTVFTNRISPTAPSAPTSETFTITRDETGTNDHHVEKSDLTSYSDSPPRYESMFPQGYIHPTNRSNDNDEQLPTYRYT